MRILSSSFVSPKANYAFGGNLKNKPEFTASQSVAFKGSEISYLDMFCNIYKNRVNLPFSKAEYTEAIKRQLSYTDECCDESKGECKSSRPLFEPYISKNPDDIELLGLASFCALHDWHEYINNYVTNANIEYPYVYNYDMTRRANIRQVKDAVGTLDYSLARLDERYGKYKGILYRTGIIDNNLKQYYATSSDPGCTISHSGILLPDEVRYGIIYTESGHKLYEFQKRGGSLGKFINDGEREILLDRKCNFRKIEHSDCNDEQLRLKRELLHTILDEYDTQNDTTLSLDLDENSEQFENYLSQIDFWETY